MAFDFKKEYKSLYLPKARPEIVQVPQMHYIAVRGQGDPNEPDGAYQQAIGVLYAVAYTLKMSYKTDHKIEGFFEYVVPPLEGFWLRSGADKSAFRWISVIRLPDFVTRVDFDWAVETAARKKNLDCSAAELLTVDEGLCVQMMSTSAPMTTNPRASRRWIPTYCKTGTKTTCRGDRLHHEIYLSDPRKTTPEKRKTVIRHPIKRAE